MMMVKDSEWFKRIDEVKKKFPKPEGASRVSTKGLIHYYAISKIETNSLANASVGGDFGNTNTGISVTINEKGK